MNFNTPVVRNASQRVYCTNSVSKRHVSVVRFKVNVGSSCTWASLVQSNLRTRVLPSLAKTRPGNTRVRKFSWRGNTDPVAEYCNIIWFRPPERYSLFSRVTLGTSYTNMLWILRFIQDCRLNWKKRVRRWKEVKSIKDKKGVERLLKWWQEGVA